MFKVECPGCKAPYQVDERRIPSSGLKMRCPKCGTSFKVDPPADDRPSGSASGVGGVFGIRSELESAPPPAFGARATAKVDLRGTIVGVAPGTAAAAPLRPGPPPNLKGTMLGVAPAGFGAARPPPAPVAQNLKGTMLGVAPAAPTLGKPPPVPPRRLAGKLPPAVAPDPDSFFDEIDLPSPVAPAGTPVFVDVEHGRDHDLPSPRRPEPLADLPIVSQARSLADLSLSPPPSEFDDLPLRAAAPSYDDLPTPFAPQPFIDLPSVASGAPLTAAPFALDLDLDLPSPVATRSTAPSVSSLGAGIELDLPTLGSRKNAPVPSVGSRNTPEVGLPSLSASRVAPPRASSSAATSPAERSRAPSRDFGEVGLPSPSAGLPASGQAGLPELSRAAFPSRSGVQLPSLAGRSRSSTGSLELDDGLPLVGGNSPPSTGSGERAQVGLPSSLSGSLPAIGAPRRQSPAAGLPALSSSGAPSSPFASLSSVPPDRPELQRMPSLPPDFGLEAMQAPPGARRTSSRARGSQPEFGDLDLPIGGPSTIPPGLGAGRDSMMDAEEADLFAEPPTKNKPRGAPERPAAEALVRQSGGGTAYGEVNLGDAGAEAEVPLDAAPEAARREEDMEFGAIPQEDRARSEALPSDAALAATKVALLKARGVRELARPKHKLHWRFGAGLLVLFLGGAALALVPTVGPFGVYVVIDRLKSGEYAELVRNTVLDTRRELSRDTYPLAKRAIATVESSRGSAKRVRALAAYAAFTGYAEELRFGSDPAVHARASVLLDELAEHDDTAYLSLARCARAAAEAQIARAKQLYDGLNKLGATDPDQAILHGEIALRAGDTKAALAIWQQAVRAENNPRSAFGLARASYAAGDADAAAKAAKSVLAQNPDHVGARILLARVNGANRSTEREALSLLNSVTSNPAPASPDELVSAQTLLGDIHLARSRMSQAEAAYSEALKINPKAARALNGLGDALYRAGRFSEAQARYEASTQADPDDLAAKIGVAKSKLALERVDDASATLKKLHDSNPQSVPVAYWYGRALEAAGSRMAAEGIYRAALALAKLDSQTVDVYIALALLQSQQGHGDQAHKTLADARAKLPDLPAIHKALGDVALSQGRYAEATVEFERAVLLDGEDLGAKFRLGVALRRDGKFEDAKKSFDEVSAVDKDYPGLSLERGLLFEASGRTEEALQEYEGALAKAPKDPDLMLRVGCGKVAAGRAKQAEDLLRKVLADRPNSAETNHCLGRALLLEGTRLTESLRLLERAVELDANRAEYQLYAGWAANEAGNVPKAEHALAEALRLDQGLADAYWQRGVLRQRQGAARDAIADLNKALELRPSRYEAHAALADAYYDLGKEPQALAEWQLAIQAQSDNATWHFRYGKLLSANHQGDAAREQLSLALELSASEDPAPRWAWEAHNLLAHAIGLKPEAVKHWEEFLRLGPRDSPYRTEAKTSLEKLGHPWAGD